MTSDSWCIMPFAHLNVTPYGYVSACWRNMSDLGNYRSENLQDIWNGPGYRSLRDDLNRGHRPDGCRSCWDMEAAGIISTRQQCNTDYQSFRDEMEKPQSLTRAPKFASVEVRFSNDCNLMCRHCNPFQSSRLERLAREDGELARMYKGYMNYDETSDVVRLSPRTAHELATTILPASRHLLFTGGEPLLQDEHMKMLKTLEPISGSKTLEYNSNLHTLSHRGESFIPYWKKYEKVTLRISIDGDPETYEYFRVGGNRQKVERNITALQEAFAGTGAKLFLQATCTTSLMQITRLHRIARYFNRLGVYFHSSLVQFPAAFNIQVLPSSLRKLAERNILSLLEGIETDPSFDEHDFWKDPAHKRRQISRLRLYIGKLLGYLRASTYKPDELHPETQRWLEKLDRIHGTDFLSVYPEFRPHWKSAPLGESARF